MNKLQEMIATLEADDDRGEWNDRLLQKLQEKQRELGDGISEEEAEETVEKIVKEVLQEVLQDAIPHLNDAAEEVWNETMQEAIDVGHRVFAKETGNIGLYPAEGCQSF